ncbi:substrate-binding domain-containing protein [Nocardioides cynanchi]|uniref:substrate-binding domain-containing protein n=1 Tax=Nocardioides cynanchi TaxID=2558918 RepID=UPI001248B391|nr:substrate-binding domain-containing protein [Nocardioides cynanchi]
MPRKISAKLGMAALAVAGLGFTALAPASADTVPGQDSVPGSYTPGTSVVGVGSDTIQWVDDALSGDYNTFNAAQVTKTPYWANFDACLGNTTAGAPGLGDNPDGSGFPCGADHTGTKAGVKRDEGVVDAAAAGGALPSGSGDGRTLLRNPSDKLFMDVAYGRSSGPLNTTDLNAGEIALPFAVDKIVVVTHPGGPAPASLSGQQLLKIYNGTYTNWNQVGGQNAAIHPYLPKAGSSTLNAFESFLAALDGTTEAPGSDNDPTSHAAASQVWQGPGNAINDSNWNLGAANVEEHDPSVTIADQNAIEPFSYGRAQLANGASQTVRIEGGWSADRELYHVVRGAAITDAVTTPFLYGSDGGLLEGLFSSTGYVCTNATAQADIATAGFWPLQAGSSTGNCGVKNNNTVDTITQTSSHGVDEGAVTTTSGQFFAGALHITVASTDASTPTGTVQVVVADPSTPSGSPAASFHKTVALASDGTATVTLPATVAGHKTVDVAFLPTNFGANSSAGGHTALGSSYAEFPANIPVAAVATKVKATAKPLVLANATRHTSVTATVKAKTGTKKPTGKIVIKRGTKKVGVGTLVHGKVTIKVKGTSLKKGTNKLVVKYVATGGFKAPKTFPTIIITRTK